MSELQSCPTYALQPLNTGRVFGIPDKAKKSKLTITPDRIGSSAILHNRRQCTEQGAKIGGLAKREVHIRKAYEYQLVLRQYCTDKSIKNIG